MSRCTRYRIIMKDGQAVDIDEKTIADITDWSRVQELQISCASTLPKNVLQYIEQTPGTSISLICCELNHPLDCSKVNALIINYCRFPDIKFNPYADSIGCKNYYGSEKPTLSDNARKTTYDVSNVKKLTLRNIKFRAGDKLLTNPYAEEIDLFCTTLPSGEYNFCGVKDLDLIGTTYEPGAKLTLTKEQNEEFRDIFERCRLIRKAPQVEIKDVSDANAEYKKQKSILSQQVIPPYTK